MSIPGYYTVPQAAEILDKSSSQVCRYIQNGHLKAVKVGNYNLIEQAEVHNFIPPPRGNPNLQRNAKT